MTTHKLSDALAQADLVHDQSRLAAAILDIAAAIDRELAGAPAVWLFSSGLAVQHLADQFPGRDWAYASALATHARIAQRAQALGFGRVLSCRPTVDDVGHSLQFCP